MLERTPLNDIELAWQAYEAAQRPVYFARFRPRLCGEQNWRCCYCGVRMLNIALHDLRYLPKKERFRVRSMIATVEHVIRRVDGGTDEWENLAASCEWCNVRRHDRSAEDWFLEVQALIGLGAHPHGVAFRP
jgi:hypothetical protein